ncbi:MAG: branched-chain amino acid ABC transporter permease [Beijerinckiaceae bacterium]
MPQILSFFLFLLTTTSITLILTISLNIQFGYAGLVNFGQVLFLCLGAYSGALAFNAGWHPALCLVIAAIVSGAGGFLMSFTVRSMSGTYWGIVTLCTAELVRLIVNNEPWIANGADGLSLIRRVGYIEPLVLGLATAALLLSLLIARSPFGRTLRLIREGDRLPLALGKDVRLFKMQTMTIGGALGGVAGCLYAFLNGYISPQDCMPIETFILWAMVVVGGSGSVVGMVLGTALVQTLYVGTRFLTHLVDLPADRLAALRLVLIGALIALTMMYRPQGLLPERRRIYKI